MKVIKRDGTVVAFNDNKIYHAIEGACNFIDDLECIQVIDSVIRNVLAVLESEKYSSRKNNVKIEDIQDVVETCLMNGGFTDVAKAYISHRKVTK